MKKTVLCILLLLTFVQFIFALPNYNNGNGTVLSEKTENGIKITVRKCELEVVIGNLLDEKYRDVYTACDKKNKIGKLHDNDKVKVLRMCRKDYLNEPKNEDGDMKGELWYNIKSDTMEGWICIYSGYIASFRDPYFDNRYEILEVIESSDKKWTVRSIKQSLSVWENLNIRAKPGTNGTNVVYTIRPGTTDPRQTNVEVIAITEERDTIDGKNDYWLKINYKDFTGWIFGGYASAERGGLKYYIPENMVHFDLGWY
jgi:hypothetical protein